MKQDLFYDSLFSFSKAKDTNTRQIQKKVQKCYKTFDGKLQIPRPKRKKSHIHKGYKYTVRIMSGFPEFRHKFVFRL